MSRSVETRVTQMEFENKNFEKSAKETLSTLEKLKIGLNALGNIKVVNTLGDISKGIANLPLNTAKSSVELVGKQFNLARSAADQFVRNTVTGLQQMAKQAIDTANIFKGGVKSGFQEYETQIGAIQTIWANTKDSGTTMNQITDALDELNKYADLTIYNFTEMTRNIGTFTAAGVSLEDSTKAIQGIANLAAMSGATSQQASTAMYQLSQALASGTVHLQDWNSVVNASMGGKLFQNKIIETAKELGVMDEKLQQVADGSISFRASLERSDWFTSDVLIKTLEKFTDATTQFGKDAIDAATKVKTFTNLLDTLKETVQSGWTQSWEYIIGDFETARDMFTSISDKIQSIIQPMSDSRNSILKFWSQNGSNSEAFAEAAKKEAEETKKMAKAVEDVIAGKYGNMQERFDKLTAEGLDYKKVQNLVNEKFGNTPMFDIEKEEKVNKLLTGREMVLKGIANLGNALLNVFNNVRIAFQEVIPPKTGKDLVDLSEKFLNWSIAVVRSTYNLSWLRTGVKGVVSIFQILGKILSAIAGGIKKFVKSLGLSRGFFKKLIESIGEFLINLNKTMDEMGVFEAISDGVAAALGWIKERIDSLMKSFNRFLNSGIGKKFVDLKDKVADFVKSFFGKRSKSDGKGIGEDAKKQADILDLISPILGKAKENFDSVRNAFSNIGDGIKKILPEVLDYIKDFIGNWLNIIKNLDIEDLKDISEILKNLGIFDLLKNITPLLKTLVKSQIISGIKKDIVELGKVFKSMVGMFETLSKNFNKVGNAISKSFKANAILKEFIAFAIVIAVLTGAIYVLSQLPLERAVESAEILAGLMIVFLIVSKQLNKLDTKKLAILFTAFGVSIGLMANAIKKLGEMKRSQLVQGFVAVALMVELLGIVIGGIAEMGKTSPGGKPADMKGIAASLIAMAVAINLLMIPLIVLSAIPFKFLLSGFVKLAILVGIITGSMILLSKFGGDVGKVALAMIAMAVAINLLVIPLIALSLIPTDTLGEAMGALVVLLVTMFGILLLLGLAFNKNQKGILAAAGAFIMLSFAMLLLTPALMALSDEKMTAAIGRFGLAILIMVGALAALALIDKATGGGITVIMALIDGFVVLLGLFAAAVASLTKAIAKLLLAIIKFSKADLSGLSNNISVALNAIIENAELFKDAIKAVLVNLLKLIAELLPEINKIVLETIKSFLTNAKEYVPIIVELFMSFLTKTLAAFNEYLPTFLEELGEFITTILDWTNENFPGWVATMTDTAISVFIEFIATVIEGIGKGFSRILEAIINTLNMIADAINTYGDDVRKAALNLLEAILKFFLPDEFVDKGKELINGLKEGFQKAKNAVVRKVKQIWAAIKEPFINAVSTFVGYGKNLVDGLSEGFTKAWDNAPIKKVIDSIKDCWSKETETRSPSRLFMRYGKYLIQGLSIGIGNNTGMVEDEIGELANILMTIGQLASNDFDIDPIIRPILDLSNITAGANSINSVFDRQRVTLSDLNSSFAKQISFSQVHNGSYDDKNVVNELGSLRTDINALGEKIAKISIVLDTGELVGSMVGPMDQALGRKQIMRGRGG